MGPAAKSCGHKHQAPDQCVWARAPPRRWLKANQIKSSSTCGPLLCVSALAGSAPGAAGRTWVSGSRPFRSGTSDAFPVASCRFLWLRGPGAHWPAAQFDAPVAARLPQCWSESSLPADAVCSLGRLFMARGVRVPLLPPSSRSHARRFPAPGSSGVFKMALPVHPAI